MTNPTEIIPISIKSGIIFSDYKVGLRLDDGNTVREILSKNKFHVLYKITGEHKIRYEYMPIDEKTQELICKRTSLIHLSEEKFHSTEWENITKRVTPIFGLIFSKNIDIANNYIEKLDEYINKKPSITKIIAECYDYTIWIDCENNSQFLHQPNSDASRLNNVIAEYIRIKAIGTSFLNEKQRGEFSEQLSAALAFSLKASKNTTAAFKESENLVSKIIENSLRTKYSIFTLLTTLSLILSLIGIANYFDLSDAVKMCIYAISGGVIGAFISVQERVKRIKCQISDPIWTLVFQAIIRIALGGVFGFIAFIASKTGIAFSFFNESSMTLIFLGIVSGFSERLIPELLQSMEKQKPKPDAV